VTGYQAFSGDEQNGNFIAVHADVDDDAVVTAEVVNGVHGPVTLDASRVVIFRITNKDTQKLKFVATKNGDSTTYEFDLSGLTLNNA
jgi:VCBS repeat-containing protein